MNHHSSHLTGSVQLRLYSPFTPRAVIHGASCVSANMTAVCHLPPPQKRGATQHTSSTTTTQCLPITIWSFQRWTGQVKGNLRQERRLRRTIESLPHKGAVSKEAMAAMLGEKSPTKVCITFRSQVCPGWAQAPKKTKRCFLSLKKVP